MSLFGCLTANKLATLSYLVGIILAQDLSGNDQNDPGNFLQSIGQIILTISARSQSLDSQMQTNDKNDYLSQQVENISSQLNLLKEQLK